MTLLVNASPALEVRLVQPWTGVWFADVDMVLDETGLVPSGKVALTLGSQVYAGTVDPRLSGSFASSARLRVVGGAGGWDQPVSAKHYHLDAGVLSTVVYSTTAAEVGETVIDVEPSTFGQDFVRAAGRASRVLDDADGWWMNPLGVTTVGPRVPIPFDPTSVDVLTWDPLERVLELGSDDPIVPGTIVVDPQQRFSGSLTVRDVEQRWSSGGGARATCWISQDEGALLQTALTRLVSEKAGLPYLKMYRYRVVLEDGQERLSLQIIDRADGVPDAIPFSMWMGVPGFGAKVLLGSEVLVAFVNGDPKAPVVVAFKSGQYPLLLEIGFAVSPLALSVGVQAQVTAMQAQIEALQTELDAIGALWAQFLVNHPAPSGSNLTANDFWVPAPTATAAVAAITAGAATVALEAAAVEAAVIPATSIRVESD